ncbi:ribosome maturation factor RimM, partial [Synechococcus sp. AH-736-M20]|nr:ribosome maturation factor RimM [Synechococcus sp. AH-736-M20]
TTRDGRKVLIPFVEAIVPEVQLEDNWLLLTPPPGLLEL